MYPTDGPVLLLSLVCATVPVSLAIKGTEFRGFSTVFYNFSIGEKFNPEI